MTDAQTALDQVREAISAEVRPGEWRISKYREGRDALIYDTNEFEVARVCYPNRDANASLIAACSPANVSAILAHVEAQEAEIERLRAVLGRIAEGCSFPADDVQRAIRDTARDALKEQR